MTTMLLSAMTIGALGSLHCIGMCGPLALSLPVPAHSHFSKLSAALLYNLGRIITYASLGAVIGLLGTTFSIFGLQQWLSIIAGAAVLFYLLFPQLFIFKEGHQRFSFLMGSLRAKLARLFKSRNYQSVFYIGLLNGFLPCGLVYTAIAAALAMGSVMKSSLFMAGFGFGTLPLMWSLAFFGTVVPPSFSIRLKKMYPYILLLMGCMLILRGLGLGIPYLSPQWNPSGTGLENSIECHTVQN
ncbi:MAG: sulfite exporter TauE/SafE family protein [Chitinophagaceae bacterium]|nr:MAG: sulfite exporter TauE/SafE family protein [Chitinophagaceae bacterium]